MSKVIRSSLALAALGATGALAAGGSDEHGCVPSAGFIWCEGTQKCHRPWEEDCPRLTVPEAPPAIPTQFRGRIEVGFSAPGEDDITWTTRNGKMIMDAEDGVLYQEFDVNVSTTSVHMQTLFDKEHMAMCRWSDGEYCCDKVPEGALPADPMKLLPDDVVYGGHRRVDVNMGTWVAGLQCDVWENVVEVEDMTVKTEFYFSDEGKFVGTHTTFPAMGNIYTSNIWVDTDPHGDCDDVICDNDVPTVDFSKTCPSDDTFIPFSAVGGSFATSSPGLVAHSTHLAQTANNNDNTMIVSGAVGCFVFATLAGVVAYALKSKKSRESETTADTQTVEVRV
eukprot:GFYU01002185.1.p2 GENE.GFYU01002185.1~~GFYU01002185.1.p2  ORF type:complete len:337 (+),score=101.53 GFYU01002185.1:66-1076(+)